VTDTYNNIIITLKKDLPTKAIPIGVAIVDYLSNSTPEDSSSISYGALKRLVKRRLKSTPDDNLLLHTAHYLLGDRVHLLDVSFNFFDEEAEIWYPINKKNILDAKATGKLKHPITSDLIDDFESHVVISYSSSEFAKNIQK
jgi:hypothetical protein